MKIAIVYTSVTGNTQELAEIIYQISLGQAAFADVELFRIEAFPVADLRHYDVVMIGTYTWGNGEIPIEMRRLYDAFEMLGRKEMITAVFGTGDSFYPNYCGAVDLFRDMLYVHTNLSATLKVELAPQQLDVQRCQQLVARCLMGVRPPLR
jgi:flavodoxin I